MHRDRQDFPIAIIGAGFAGIGTAIQRYEEAMEILEKYYPLAEFPESALMALQELLPTR